MNKSDSWMRAKKRKAMSDHGTTFTDRVREAVRTGKPVNDIQFRLEKPDVMLEKESK